MTTSRFGDLAPSKAAFIAPNRHPCLGERLANRLDFLCQHPFNRVIAGFTDGAKVHYRKNSSVLSVGVWTDTDGTWHWRLGRMELEVSEKQTQEARLTRALEAAGNRWGWGDAWDEIVALGIKARVGAPARQLIYQGRWRDLDAWVVQRRAKTALRRGA